MTCCQPHRTGCPGKPRAAACVPINFYSPGQTLGSFFSQIKTDRVITPSIGAAVQLQNRASAPLWLLGRLNAPAGKDALRGKAGMALARRGAIVQTGETSSAREAYQVLEDHHPHLAPATPGHALGWELASCNRLASPRTERRPGTSRTRARQRVK